MKLKQILKNVWYLQDKKPHIGKMFARIQEYYESDVLRGKIFTLESLLEKHGAHYLHYWEGFNMPSRVFEPFFKGKFNPLSKEEKELLKMVRPLKKPFYLIASNGYAPTVTHELCHGLYHIDAGYRKKVNTILAHVNVKDIERFLASKRYHKAVWRDEVQASLIASHHWLATNHVDVKKYLGVAKRLRRVFNEYYLKNKI